MQNSASEQSMQWSIVVLVSEVLKKNRRVKILQMDEKIDYR